MKSLVEVNDDGSSANSGDGLLSSEGDRNLSTNLDIEKRVCGSCLLDQSDGLGELDGNLRVLSNVGCAILWDRLINSQS